MDVLPPATVLIMPSGPQTKIIVFGLGAGIWALIISKFTLPASSFQSDGGWLRQYVILKRSGFFFAMLSSSSRRRISSSVRLQYNKLTLVLSSGLFITFRRSCTYGIDVSRQLHAVQDARMTLTIGVIPLPPAIKPIHSNLFAWYFMPGIGPHTCILSPGFKA